MKPFCPIKYIRTHIHIQGHECIIAYTHVHARMHMQTYMHAHTHKHTCMHAHIYICARTHTHKHTYTTTHTYAHTHKHTHTHIYIHTCTCTCITTANFGYMTPNSGGEPAGGIRTRDPIGSGDTCPNTPTTWPLVQIGYSSVGLQDPRDERGGVQP